MITQQKPPQQTARYVPANDLDLQMSITNPAWQELSPELRGKLVKQVGEKIIKGEKEKVYEELAGVLGIYTRDIRLGNISPITGEFDFIVYYLELAVDLLSVGMVESSITSLNKALSRLEPSSSRGGFVRKLLNTVRNENVNKTLEPEKRRIMGKKMGES